MAENNEPHDYEWFMQIVFDELAVRAATAHAAPLDVAYDNADFRSGPGLARLNHMIVQPGLSNRLYAPGRQNGFVVYGLGGPRVLLSHPFKGATTEAYDIYRNSLDVVTSLLLRGYTGTFLFLDNLAGLNVTMAGLDAWAIWFSVIAAHSDLVVILVEGDSELSPSQRAELALTPDRVHKKLVRLPAGELRWAKETAPDVADRTFLYAGAAGRPVSRDEYLSGETRLALPFIEQQLDPDVPRDALIIGDVLTGQLDRYPLDFADYTFPGRP